MPITQYFEIEAIAARPREHLSGAEWAERYRVLTSMTSGVTGPWQGSFFRVAEGVLNALTSDNVSEVAWCSGTQNAKTETILNAIGYMIHQTPAPIMLIYPEKDDCKSMSKIRIADMLDNSRGGVLAKRVDMSEKRSDIFNIPFVGGVLMLAWATNVNKLASKPVKYLFLDEIDKYRAIKGHGSPLALARERQKAFPHAKLFMASSPTYEEGAIWQALHEADYMFKFNVACPHCGGFFVFGFECLRSDDGASVHYECPRCTEKLYDRDKIIMLNSGFWQTDDGLPLDEILERGSRLRLGFRSSSFCSPLISFTDIWRKHERSKSNPDDFKVFVNGWLGEPYDDSETGMEQMADELMKHTEDYDKLPHGVCRLTCGVDVQKDRIEALVMGWGAGRESWVIDKKVIYGDPLQSVIWRELHEFLVNGGYEHENGARLPISCTAIDSGYLANEVYRFCTPRQRVLNVFAVKGGNRADLPAISAPQRAGPARQTKLFTLGVHNLKSTLYYWLSVQERGAGYVHFKQSVCDKEFFEQLTAEKLITRVEHGKRIEIWEKVRDRNEALDTAVYALGALLILNPDLERLAAALG